MLININKNLGFKDNPNIIISLGIDTLKIQIMRESNDKLFNIIKNGMEEYITITLEPNTNHSYIIYDNSIINPETNHGTSIGRIASDMITLYGLNQIYKNDTQLKVLHNLFSNYTYEIRQLDFNIDIFGLAKDRISCVNKTLHKRFYTTPREQLKSNYTYLSGIGTTNIIIPNDNNHKSLIKKIKKIINTNEKNTKYGRISNYLKYKTFKEIKITKFCEQFQIKSKYAHILFKVQIKKDLDKIFKLIDNGNYKVDYNHLITKDNHKYISIKTSKRSLIKQYNKISRYEDKGYDSHLIEDFIESKIINFKNQYILDDIEYDKFELQESYNWIRTEFVSQFCKSGLLSFNSTQIEYLSQKIYQKTQKLKTRFFNIGQRGKSRLHEFIKYNNTKEPIELYNLEPVKNNFFEYQPSLEDINKTLHEFIDKVNLSS